MQPAVGLRPKVIWLVAMELGTLNQLVLRPTEMELVCTWRRQPMWSAGQETVSRLPERALAIVTGAVLTTRSVPSVTRVLVFQARPWPGVAGVSAAKAPR